MKPRLLISTLIAIAALFVIYGAVTGGEKKKIALATDVTSDESATVQQTRNPAAGEEINWQVISSGGTDGSSASYKLKGTAGQTGTTVGNSASYTLRGGFWQEFPPGGAECVPGDADNSGEVDIDDVVYEIAYIFSGGPAPVPAECCGDADGSGGESPVDIDDVVYLIAYIFSSGPAPVDAC